MSKFIVELLKELHDFQDETPWLTLDSLKAMLSVAAIRAVDDIEKVTLFRLIDPECLTPLCVLRIDGADEILLFSEHITTLRALLMSFDEHAPAQLNEPLTIPMQLEDGRVVSKVVAEMLLKESEEKNV